MLSDLSTCNISALTDNRHEAWLFISQTVFVISLSGLQHDLWLQSIFPVALLPMLQAEQIMIHGQSRSTKLPR